MANRRTPAEHQVADLLRTAKKSLRLSVAFLSRLDGTTQHLEVVESSVPFVFQEGVTQRQETSLCQAILDRKLPPVIPNLRDFPEQERRTEIERRLGPVVAAGGPVVALQPIVDLTTGARVGAEALSRFPAEWGKAPDVCFAEAHGVGQGHRLELLALERAAEHLDRVGGYVAMNVSPATLLTAGCAALLDRLPLHRVLLELSEHDPVEDYAALTAALAPFRAAGLRLAIDDVGAGFSSLRHIVVTAPDVLKIDRSLVSGLDRDPVLTTLVRSLVEFGHGCGARVVAEGVETAAESDALRLLGVDHGQGWFHGRPGPPEALASVARTAALAG